MALRSKVSIFCWPPSIPNFKKKVEQNRIILSIFMSINVFSLCLIGLSSDGSPGLQKGPKKFSHQECTRHQLLIYDQYSKNLIKNFFSKKNYFSRISLLKWFFILEKLLCGFLFWINYYVVFSFGTNDYPHSIHWNFFWQIYFLSQKRFSPNNVISKKKMQRKIFSSQNLLKVC